MVQPKQQLLAFAAALEPDAPENALVVQGFRDKADVERFIRRLAKAGLLEIEGKIGVVLDGDGNAVTH